MGVKIYDANNVTVVALGVLVDSGFADGEFIRIEQDDGFVDYQGTDGEVTRSKTNEKRCTITLLLAQSSTSNAALSLVHSGDLAADGGAGVGPFMVRDRQGLSLFTTDAAWITKFPDETYDREVTTREWMFRAVVTPANRFVGGN